MNRYTDVDDGWKRGWGEEKGMEGKKGTHRKGERETIGRLGDSGVNET